MQSSRLRQPTHVQNRSAVLLSAPRRRPKARRVIRVGDSGAPYGERMLWRWFLGVTLVESLIVPHQRCWQSRRDSILTAIVRQARTYSPWGLRVRLCGLRCVWPSSRSGGSLPQPVSSLDCYGLQSGVAAASMCTAAACLMDDGPQVSSTSRFSVVSHRLGLACVVHDLTEPSAREFDGALR